MHRSRTGRSAATIALAVIALAAALLAPATALAAPPTSNGKGPGHSNGVVDCVDVTPGGPQQGGNFGNDHPNGAVACDQDETADPGQEDTDPDDTNGDDTDPDDTNGDDTDTADTDDANDTDDSRAPQDDSDTDDTDTDTDDTDDSDPAAVCTGDLLVAYTPDGSDGDVRAVALTAQALDAGTAGWLHVSWEAADGVTVTTMAVLRRAGVDTLGGDDLTAGTAEDVLAIAFCGDREQRDDGSSSGETDVRAVVLVRPPSGADVAATGTPGDTEVLGVTLARTGTTVGRLAAIGLAAMLAGSGALAATRRRHERAV